MHTFNFFQLMPFLFSKLFDIILLLFAAAFKYQCTLARFIIIALQLNENHYICPGSLKIFNYYYF